MNARARWTVCASALLAGCALLASARPARACGGFFSEHQSEVVAMSDLRVLLVRQGDRVDQYVQIGYRGKSARFAWVYPVASNPEVEEVKSSPFAALDELTRPRINIGVPSSGGGGFGCGAAAMDARGGGREVVPTVKVWQTGQVGAFDYAVINAPTADELLGWLNTNGFAVPGTTRTVLQHYLAQKWLFVAMKVSVQSVSAEVPSTTVVRLGYAATELRYPLRMISLSASAETSLELYVIADGGVTPVAPFSVVTVESSQLHATSETTHDYEQVFAANLKAGGPRSLAWEYSSRYWSSYQLPAMPRVSSGQVLTRLRTVLQPGVMDEDLILVPTQGVERSPQYYLTWVDGGGRAGFPAPVAALILLALAWRAARRPRY